MQQFFACINSVPLKRRNLMVDLHQRIEMKMMTDSFSQPWFKLFSHNKIKKVSQTSTGKCFSHYRFLKTWFRAIFRAKMKQTIFFAVFTRIRVKDRRFPNLKKLVLPKGDLLIEMSDYDWKHSTPVELKNPLETQKKFPFSERNVSSVY